MGLTPLLSPGPLHGDVLEDTSLPVLCDSPRDAVPKASADSSASAVILARGSPFPRELAQFVGWHHGQAEQDRGAGCQQ